MCSTEPSAAACFVLAAWQLSMMLLMVKSQYRMRSTADAGCWMLDARRAVRQKTGVAPQSTHHHLHSDRRRRHHSRPACKPSQLLQRLLTSCLQSSIAPALDVPLRAHQHLGDRCPTNSLIARPTVAVVCTASIVQLLTAQCCSNSRLRAHFGARQTSPIPGRAHCDNRLPRQSSSTWSPCLRRLQFDPCTLARCLELSVKSAGCVDKDPSSSALASTRLFNLLRLF